MQFPECPETRQRSFAAVKSVTLTVRNDFLWWKPCNSVPHSFTTRNTPNFNTTHVQSLSVLTTENTRTFSPKPLHNINTPKVSNFQTFLIIFLTQCLISAHQDAENYKQFFTFTPGSYLAKCGWVCAKCAHKCAEGLIRMSYIIFLWR